MPLYKTKWNVEDELVQELRSRFLADLEETNPDLYHPDDIARMKENDWYVARYILHQHNNIDNALKMAKESLKWRKEFEANTISRSDLPTEYFNSRAILIYNEDKNGNPIVVIRTKTHFKNESVTRTQQLYTIYWVEKAIRSRDWGIVTVLFDCTDAGAANMDIDMVRFVMNLFKKYYPWALAFFIVYNMPWYLTGIWKVIKPFIPERYVNKVNFVDQVTIQDLINPDQLPVAIGGTHVPGSYSQAVKVENDYVISKVKCTRLYEPKEGAEDVPDEDEYIHSPETAQS